MDGSIHIVRFRYVRRELRELTTSDREDYLTAASTLWKVSTKAGRELGYGSSYRDINSLAIIHNDLAGNVVSRQETVC